MKKIIFLSVSAFALLFFTASDSFACSCVLPSPTTTLEQRVLDAKKQYKAVFSDKVIETEEEAGSFLVKVKFQVEKIWKRDLPETVTIMTGRGKGDCGYQFSVGETYLVYANGTDENDFLGVGICSRTAHIDAAKEDLEILGKGKSPKNKNNH